MTQLLSPFAISVAANAVTSLFARNDTEKEIRKTFQEAIEMWCPNEEIRRFKEKEIRELINHYIDNPALDTNNLSEEQQKFLSYFEKCLANYHSAELYLSSIKSKEHYDMVMASLNSAHAKLDSISHKLDDANLKHEELHFDAVAELNTILDKVVKEPVNTLLYGILSAFDEDIFAYIEVKEDHTVEVVIDKDSRLVNTKDGDKYRHKFQDMDYDWDKEPPLNWSQMNSDQFFMALFEDSLIAAFQLIRINFNERIDLLQSYIDRKSINDQLSTDEKRQLNEIVANMRALQATMDDHDDIFCKTDTHFKNLETSLSKSTVDQGEEIGFFTVCYNDGEYKEMVTQTIAPIEAKDFLLDVIVINPDYYVKLAGYVGGLYNSVVGWWKMSN